MRLRTFIGLTALGVAAAGGTVHALRRKPRKIRCLAGGAVFLLPFGVYAVTSKPPLVTVLFISDTHDTPPATAVRIGERIARETGVDLVVNAGDIGDEGCGTYERWWDIPYAPVVALWPVIAASGNHDNPQCFMERFGTLPRKASMRGVDFFVLPWAGQISREVLTWLDHETAASTATVKVLVVHKGPWHISADEGRVFSPPATLLPILRRIDLILSGHNHVFWNTTHNVGGHVIRHVVEISGKKFYSCVPAARHCRQGQTGYSRIEIYGPDDIRVVRRTFR